MTINIRALNMELTEAIRQYAEEKFQSLEKYEPTIMHVDMQIGKETNHHHKGDIFTCSATLEVSGDVLKIERSEDDLYSAIDKVKDHFRETLAQRKERMEDQKRGV